jgi:hypothetical protein
MVKSARSSVVTSDVWRNNAPDDRHFGVHLIAYGCTPWYLFNRNRDAFSDTATQRKVATFVSHGAVYEEHKHHDRKFSKGNVKFAAWNPEMHRAELIVHVDKDKMPDAYEDAKAGKELGWSMGCKVAGDVSECCNHFARTPDYYCDHMLRRKGQYIPERRKYAYVWNPEPTFFDISRVKRPACRIAYYLSYRLPGGEKVAAHTDVSAGYSSAVTHVKTASSKEYDLGKYSKTASTLSQLEERVSAHLTSREISTSIITDGLFAELHTKHAFTIEEAAVNELRGLRVESVFHKLASRRIILPPVLFYALALDRSVSEIQTDTDIKTAVALVGNGVRMCNEYDFTEYDVDQFSGAGATPDPNDNVKVAAAINTLAEVYGLDMSDTHNRIVRSTRYTPLPELENTMRGIAIKTASALSVANSTSKGLAAAYGLYQIAAIHDMNLAINDNVELHSTIKKVALFH